MASEVKVRVSDSRRVEIGENERDEVVEMQVREDVREVKENEKKGNREI